ncbi:MAG TPA: IPT/TIG domain-containing protein [Thermoanaerobaculia bacterium]|jgi:hypothetical protein
MLTKRASFVAALLVSFPLFAQTPESIAPPSGPTSGGTEVTIKGDFAEVRQYQVLFGEIPARSTTRVDAQTLVVVTPAHLPGASQIWISEGDVFARSSLKFTFTGGAPLDEFARLLVPINIHAVKGAQGSEFYTELYAIAKRGTPGVYGLLMECWFVCVRNDPWDYPERLTTEEAKYGPPDATPERFLYIRRQEAGQVSLSLRAYDVSRDEENYGTTIPVVNFDEASDTVIAFPSVPSHPKFRNTLRIYSDVAMKVTIEAGDVQEVVQLEPGASVFEPAFAMWGNFPSDAGQIRVRLTAEVANNPPAYLGRIWALLTVTNNDTQHITALWPQP